jgi:glycosyltransferase involved in cell wall biosynthesis
VTDCVWYVSKYFGLPANRVGSRAFMLMRELAALGMHPMVFTANTNHLFTIRDLAGPSQLERIEGVDICWLKLRQYKGARSLSRIFSWLEFEWKLWRLPKHGLPPPSVIVVSSLSLLTIVNGLHLKARFGCRLVFEVRDIWPLTLVEEGGFSPRNPFVMALHWVERMAYLKSDAIIGTMPNLQQHVREVAGKTRPVHCIPIGIDRDQITDHPNLPADYTATHIPKNKFIVCHAGTIGQTNALEVLFETARLMQSNSDVHFLLVGDGDLRADFEVQTSDLHNVSFAPAVPKNLVQAVLRQCNVTYFSAYPSKVWDYGMSLNKLIDYMLAGRPIIGSYSGFPSMLNESGGGSFVPAGDAAALQAEIMRLVGLEPAERQAMGQAARDWVIANRQYTDLARAYRDILFPQRFNLEPAAGRP